MPKKIKLSKEQIEEIKNHDHSTNTIKHFSDKFNVSRSFIRRTLIKLGIKLDTYAIRQKSIFGKGGRK